MSEFEETLDSFIKLCCVRAQNRTDHNNCFMKRTSYNQSLTAIKHVKLLMSACYTQMVVLWPFQRKWFTMYSGNSKTKTRGFHHEESFIFAAFKDRLKASIRTNFGMRLCYLSAADCLNLKMNNLARTLFPFLTMLYKFSVKKIIGVISNSY